MPQTKKASTQNKTKGVMIYLSDEERSLLDSDLARANSHRTKNKLSMNELLRSRVFTKIQGQKQATPQPIQPPFRMPDIETLIKDSFAKLKPNPGLLEGEAASLAGLLEQIIVENRNITIANVEQIRKDMLDLKDDLVQLKQTHSQPLH